MFICQRSAKLFIGFAFSASLALANLTTSIAVTNHSFETLPSGGLPVNCGTGCSYNIGAIPGWTSTPGIIGQIQPGFQAGTFTRFNGPSSDGTLTSAFSNGVTISQTLGSVVQAGAIYTLTVDIGNQKETRQTGMAELFINDIGYQAVGAPPADGDWSVYTVTYTGTAADAGASIAIRLLAVGGAQANFDNVGLTEEVAPEPGFYGIMTLGLSGVALAVHRRRKA